MAGVDVGDPNLPIITEVFRSFLMKEFEPSQEFLACLFSASLFEQDVLNMKTADELLNYMEKSNKKGTYAAFMNALRSDDTSTGRYYAGIIEGCEWASRESECREHLKHLFQAYASRFTGVNPSDILPHIHDLRKEEGQQVRQKTDNEGDIRGAMQFLTFLMKKGPECFDQLLEGLRNTGKGKLAAELQESFTYDDGGDCKKLSAKLCDDANDFNTGTIVDQPVKYSDSPPADDNASGCDTNSVSAENPNVACASLSAQTSVDANLDTFAENPNVACTSLSAQTSVDTNLDTSQVEKTDPTAKDVPSESVATPPHIEEQDDDEDAPSSDESELASPQVLPIQLRNYQEELVAPALLEGKNAVIVAPTGSGKTVVAARLAKAVLDREPNVGPRTGSACPPKLVKDGSNKVIFIVNKVPLVKQQCDVFKTYIEGNRIMGLSGEVGHIGSLLDLLERKDVLVMTAQILVNALQGRREDNECMELSQIGLLILDECHHCQKGDPYNEIMAEYCSLKLSSPKKPRPQVLGLTASMGVGKAKTRYKAQTHILTLCANLDAQQLCTVQDPDNLEELRKKRDKPTEVILPVPARKSDGFKKVIEKIMAKIEDFIIETPGGEIIRKECSELKCPPSRGTQVYEQWLVRMQDYIAGHVEDNAFRMRLVTCVDNLKVYNNSLYINRDARTRDALGYLTNHMEQNPPHSPLEQQIMTLFTESQDNLQEISLNPANRNPLLGRLSKTLIEALSGKEQSRGILFCRTRAATEALLAWIEDTDKLKFLKPGRLIGCGGTGMTQKQQTELLSLFRDGNHQLILATSVAEEGLDIQQCNVVIRYNYISNDIGRVQAQGRNRAKDGKFYLIVSEELKLHEREFMNQIREKMMFEATQNIQKMTEADFLEQIAKSQKKSKLERKLKKFNSQMMKHDKKLMKVHLICRRCGAEACTADDIRCIQSAHHIVLSEAFERCCEFIDVQPGSISANMEVRKQIVCGNKEKSCTQEWGHQMLYQGCLVNLISPKHFVMRMPKGPARRFKKWKDVPFKIPELPLEELDKICNRSLESSDEDEEEEEEEEDGSEEQEQEAIGPRADGDGMALSTDATVNGEI